MSVLAPGAFRLLLAVAVLASHMSRFNVGLPAVMCFFSLSGYWVARMYDEKYRANGVGVFYLSRSLRIWVPFVFAALIGMALMLARGQNVTSADFAALMILGIESHKSDPTGVAWSLDIELQFYLLVPILCLLVGRHFATVTTAKVVATVAVVLALSLTGFVVRDQLGLGTVLIYLPSFALGLLLWRWRPSVPARAALLSVCAFLAVGMAVSWQDETRFLVVKQGSETSVIGLGFAMAWAATLLPFLAWNVARPSGRFDQHLGNLSYSLYIVHMPVLYLCRDVLMPEESTLATKVASAGLAVAASVLFYVVVDRTADAFRRVVVARATAARLANRALAS